MLLEVSYQAYTDSVFVPVVVVRCAHTAVGTFFLLPPAKSDLDLTIFFAVSVIAVINDKMVSQSSPSPLFVIFIESCGIAEITCRMMDDYASPSIEIFEMGRWYPLLVVSSWNCFVRICGFGWGW